MEFIITRGEIYIADLPSTIGSEQGGVRPVLIIQNDVGNYYSPTTIVAPLTSHIKTKPSLPTHVKIKAMVGLPYDSIVMLEQIKTIDKSRLIKKIGKLNYKQIYLINKSLLISLGV